MKLDEHRQITPVHVLLAGLACLFVGVLLANVPIPYGAALIAFAVLFVSANLTLLGVVLPVVALVLWIVRHATR